MTKQGTNEGRVIQYVALSDIQMDPRNPKAHDVGLVGDSVGRFGFAEPLVRDERTGLLISGHGRTTALRERQAAGQEPPEGIQSTDSGEWLVPVVTGWASADDNEAAAALIALNRTTEVGGWVDDSLLAILDDLAATGDEEAFAGVGYYEDDLDALTALLARVDPEDTERDLDSLAEEFGAPTEDDALRRVVLRLPPDLAAQAEEALKAGASHASVVREWLGL